MRTESKIKQVTFLENEINLNDAKREINILKSEYLGLFLENFSEIMTYQESSQFISDDLKKTENPRLI